MLPLGKVGRPRIQVDLELLTKLASIGCTMEEMGSILKCSVDTLENNFSDVIREGRSKGKSSVRRMLWKHAEQTGNSVALKYLVTNVLKEKMEAEINVNNEFKVILEDYTVKK